MNFRKLLLASAATAAASASFIAPTQASIIDRPHFKVEPIIIVWATGATNDGSAIASDFIVGSESTDLISTDGSAVQTGTLNRSVDAIGTLGNVLDAGGNAIDTDDLAGSTFSAFDVTSANVSGSGLEWTSSFYVASNTAFDIMAEVTNETIDGDDFALDQIGFALSAFSTAHDVGTIDVADNAQDPQGTFPAIDSFDDLTGGEVLVYDGTRRTAAASGSITEQSVRFDAIYTFLENAYDLSDGSGAISADVTYTFYVA
ncbi:MAG: hypothetical protein AAGL90_16670 [Pseudomonadota bacterium]